MLAAGWEDLTHAGAFLLGAVLATIAVLRVVRAVTSVFEGLEARRSSRRRRPPSSVELEDDELEE